ncbi:MAG TPA: HAMP domain-containing sensor histidine kinase [Chloroflexota bacterium]
MRPLLRAYVALIAVVALMLLALDMAALGSWSHSWSIELAVGLLALTVLGEHLQFEVRRGWYTNCSAVPHLAAAFLLPPAVAMLIAMVGAGARALRYPLPPMKLLFNAAAISVAVVAAAHVVGPLGGPELVRSGGAWSDPLAAIVASATYYSLSAATVALAVALDQHRRFLDVIRGKFGFKAIGEVGLGLVGSMLAAMLTSAPNWAPMLVVPAGLLYFAKRSMDRADRRSHNLAVTSSVGRAVAGTLDPERAFEAITSRAVLDGLKLDGLGVLPLSDPALFGEHVIAELDRPELRGAVVRELALRPRVLEFHGGGTTLGWLPDELQAPRLAVVAIPFGAGAGRPVGVLIAWRDLLAGRPLFLNQEEQLVLKTLADYGAVAFETARLAQETARLHHEAGQAEALREMESLREVTRLKDEFLGQVSHELRTPLTIIHGYSELMVDGLITREDEDLVRQSAEEIHSSSTLMLRLVDDLLDTSRLDAGRIELKLEDLELSSWLERVVSRFGQTCGTHHVVADVRAGAGVVAADPHRLGQVMNNLLSNAVRYSAAETEIRVGADVLGDGSVEIQVSDRGPGILPEDCERIFEKFYRGKDGSTLAVRGTGLGLAVARQLVEAHGGSIGVHSTLGEGSTFWVRLPSLSAAPSARIPAA